MCLRAERREHNREGNGDWDICIYVGENNNRWRAIQNASAMGEARDIDIGWENGCNGRRRQLKGKTRYTKRCMQMEWQEPYVAWKGNRIIGNPHLLAWPPALHCGQPTMVFTRRSGDNVGAALLAVGAEAAVVTLSHHVHPRKAYSTPKVIFT